MTLSFSTLAFGQTSTIRLSDVSYWNPSIILFYSETEDEGNPVQLVQHVSQISPLFVKFPRTDLTRPKVGFRVEGEQAA